jgi:hypothetical protein
MMATTTSSSIKVKAVFLKGKHRAESKVEAVEWLERMAAFGFIMRTIHFARLVSRWRILVSNYDDSYFREEQTTGALQPFAA